MLLSYGLVRLPGPDSSFKMLLSSEFFVVMMIRIWQSGQVMEFGDLVGAANTEVHIWEAALHSVPCVSNSIMGKIREGTYSDSALPLCVYSLGRIYFVTHPVCLGCLQTML